MVFGGCLLMIRQYFELLTYRALAELKRDSSGMYLGMLWWVLEPVLYMLVFYVVFGVGLKKGGGDFALYLLCGLVPWKWIDSTVRTSSGAIIASAGLMRQLYFPKWLLPGYVILANTYKFLIIFFLLVVFLLALGVSPSASWVWLPAVFILNLLFVASLSLVASAFVPLIPDLRYVVSYGMTMLFFMSGIFFSVSELGEPVKSWLLWLPTVLIIDAYRSVLLYDQTPHLSAMLHILFPSLLLFAFGAFCLARLDRYYPRVVG